MYAEADRAVHPARRRASTRAARRAASRSPTSRSSRSPRRISLDARAAGHGRADRGALSGVEVERLFAVARSLRDEGRALVFISHRFDEVFALCDTVTVMRDGEYVSTDAVADTSVDEIVAPDGRPRGRRPVPQDRRRDRRRRARGRRAHPAAACSTTSRFTVRAGEIVGLAGLVGAGRSEIARAVFGVDRYDAGTVRLAGQRRAAGTTRAPRSAPGIAFVPEDRRKQGLVIESVGGPQRRRRDPPAASTHGGLLTSARREPGRRPVGRPARGQDQRARHDTPPP